MHNYDRIMSWRTSPYLICYLALQFSQTWHSRFRVYDGIFILLSASDIRGRILQVCHLRHVGLNMSDLDTTPVSC